MIKCYDIVVISRSSLLGKGWMQPFVNLSAVLYQYTVQQNLRSKSSNFLFSILLGVFHLSLQLF